MTAAVATPTMPELMSPAGDWDCARAAVENGADAVYFGLQDGFNARARAANFGMAELPELMTYLRTHGVRGYLTLNTLVFDDEMAEAEQIARAVVAAGVDAVLVQDLGLLRLLHRLCPELPLHASTQMTLSSAECIREIESLGVRRVVLPRELSIEQIAAVHSQTNIELEAFVHGALCISYSGQCLASLSMGGRSANRGQCAQPCRLPYEVIGARGQEFDIRFPLSPHDLAAYDRLPELIAAGVSAMKIEGRLKPPEYVACVTRHYRAALDAACNSSVSQRERDEVIGPEAVAEMEVAFSRGFCHGWLDGDDHQTLVSGSSSTKRGVLLGEVRGVRGERIVVELSATVRRGDGVVFESRESRDAEQGGRVYEIFRGRRSVEEEAAGGQVELAFRYGSIDLAKIELGQKVWKTDDPHASRRLRQSGTAGQMRRGLPLDILVEAAVGSPLCITVTAATGVSCRLQSSEPLAEATKHPLTAETIAEQLGRLGKTPFILRRIEARIDGRPMIPLSVLGKLRHEMIEQLQAAAAKPLVRAVLESSALVALRAERAGGESGLQQNTADNGSQPQSLIPCPSSLASDIHVLCRTLEQIRAALQCGVSSVIAELRDIEQCGEAVQIVRDDRAKILLATPRIHKPGESDVFDRLAAYRPNGILVRNLAGLAFCRRKGLPAVADFSLNAVNALSVNWLHDQGAARVTAAYDLSPQRMLDLAATVDPALLEVVVQRHTPMFHSEYCLYCRLFSRGKNSSDCGRPCRKLKVRLRDRCNVEHLLLADSQCRNTLFHAEAESLLNGMPALKQQGVRHFRVELLAEKTKDDVQRILLPFANAAKMAQS